MLVLPPVREAAAVSILWGAPEHLSTDAPDSASVIRADMEITHNSSTVQLGVIAELFYPGFPDYGRNKGQGIYYERNANGTWSRQGPFTDGPEPDGSDPTPNNTDIHFMFDGHDTVHAVFEAAHYADVSGDRHIGYQVQGDAAWGEHTPLWVSDTTFSGDVSPRMFLDKDRESLHVCWKQGGQAHYRVKSTAAGLSGAQGWGDSITVLTEFAGATPVVVSGPDSTAVLHIFGSKTFIVQQNPEVKETHVRHAWGPPPLPTDTTWVGEDMETLRIVGGDDDSWETEVKLAVPQGTGPGTAGPLIYHLATPGEGPSAEPVITFRTLDTSKPQGSWWEPPLSSDPIVLSVENDGLESGSPVVVPDGTGVHVFWQDRPVGQTKTADFVLHRYSSVSSPSSLTDWSPIANVVADDPATSMNPAAAVEGSALLVAYSRLVETLTTCGNDGNDTCYVHALYFREGQMFTDSTDAPMTWANSVFLDRDFVVPADSTLTIAAGTIIQVADEDQWNVGIESGRVEIIVEGTLVIEGTPTNPVRIAGGVGTSGAGSWYGIRLKNPGSTSTLANVIIEDAEHGVIGEGAPLSMTNVAFNHCATEQVRLAADTTIPAGGAWSGLADTSAALVIGVDGDGTGGVDGSRIELIVAGDLLLGGASATLQSAATSPGAADWYGVRLETGSTAYLSDTTIRNARCGVAIDRASDGVVDPALYTQVIGAASSGSTGDNLHSVSFLRDYELTWPLTVPAGQAVGFHVQDRGESGVDTVRVELVLSGSGQLTLGAGSVLRSDADAPAAGDWYGVRTAADSLLGNVVPSGPPAPAIRNARAAIAHEDPARGWPDLATLASSIAFSDNVADLGFDRDRVVDSLDARTIPAGFRLGFREVDADSVSQGGKCELVVEDGGKLVADASGGAQISIGSTVPAAAAAAGDWYGIRLLTMAEAETGYGFLACQAGCGDFCSGCDAEKSVFKNVVISDSETGLSIEGNVAPEISGAAFNDITNDRDIYLANRDVVIPVDFEWNLTAPTHVVAKNVTSLPDSLEHEYGTTDRIDLIVDGLLNTETNLAGELVHFEPETKNNSSADDWGGVFISWANSGHLIDHAEFSHAANPLFIDWPGYETLTTVRNSSIHHYADVGLWVHGTLSAGVLLDTLTVSRGAALAATNGLVGVFLDRADQGTLSNSVVDMAGPPTPTATIYGVETYFGKQMCPDTVWTWRSLDITGNEIAGPGSSVGSYVNGLYSNYTCGGYGGTVTISGNWIHDCARYGMEFAQNSEVQVSCNHVNDNGRAVELWRDSEPTGNGVRFKTNFLESPEGQGAVIRTTNVLKTQMGGMGLKGDNYVRTNGQSSALKHFIYEDEPGNTNALSATKNYWTKNDVLLTTPAVILDSTLVWTTLSDTLSGGADRPNVDAGMPYTSKPDSTSCWALSPSQSARVGRHLAAAVGLRPESPEPATSVGQIPTVTRVGVPAPNPSHGPFRVQLEISPSHEGRYRIEVFDVAGRRVSVVMDGLVRAGATGVEWKGRSDDGGTVAPGVYFLRVEGPGIRKTSKMVVTR